MTRSRRNFLLAAGAGSAVAIAAGTLAANKSAVSRAASANDKPASRGYQASAHVVNYYRTTKV
jgi:hypothetical protein